MWLDICVVLLPECLNKKNLNVTPETSAGQNLYVLGHMLLFFFFFLGKVCLTTASQEDQLVLLCVMEQKETFSIKKIVTRESCVSRNRQKQNSAFFSKALLLTQQWGQSNKFHFDFDPVSWCWAKSQKKLQTFSVRSREK